MTGTSSFVVFAGPSLSGSPYVPFIGSHIRPPICSGDLTKAIQGLAPGASILIIDGEFGQSLAITITEIRNAINRGFRLFGASSMGALRAVECAPIGMTGLGAVTTMLKEGKVVSDDEVALIYEPDSYCPITAPFVNVRQLIEILTERCGWRDEVRKFFEQMRRLHFRRRTFGVLRHAAIDILPGNMASEVDRLVEPSQRRSWDLKLIDAECAVGMLLTGENPKPSGCWAPVPESYGELT